jgi:hypothetical protein
MDDLDGRCPPWPALAEGGGMAGAGTCPPPGLAPPGFAPVRRIPIIGRSPALLLEAAAPGAGVGAGGATVQGAFGATGSSGAAGSPEITGAVSTGGSSGGVAALSSAGDSDSAASEAFVNER